MRPSRVRPTECVLPRSLLQDCGLCENRRDSRKATWKSARRCFAATFRAANTATPSPRLRGLARVRPGWYSGAVDDAFTKEELSPLESRIPRNGFVELRCPFCKSTELKRISLVYQEGLARVKTRSRLLGFVFGEGGI